MDQSHKHVSVVFITYLRVVILDNQIEHETS